LRDEENAKELRDEENAKKLGDNEPKLTFGSTYDIIEMIEDRDFSLLKGLVSSK